MKEWNRPEMWELNANLTEAGGCGGDSDGVQYKGYGVILIGTSGSELGDPWEVVK